MDGVQRGMGADNRRHLLPGIALGIEHHHFHISPCAFEQLGNVCHAAVNKDDFAGIGHGADDAAGHVCGAGRVLQASHEVGKSFFQTAAVAAVRGAAVGTRGGKCGPVCHVAHHRLVPIVLDVDGIAECRTVKHEAWLQRQRPDGAKVDAARALQMQCGSRRRASLGFLLEHHVFNVGVRTACAAAGTAFTPALHNFGGRHIGAANFVPDTAVDFVHDVML